MPPLVLALARKPVDFFTFNPWLKRLPDYLAASQPPLTDKLGRLWDIALFWFSADGTFGVEWGFAVTVGDLVRFGALSLIVATYFALWIHRRESRSEEHTSELQSRLVISYAVFCLKKKKYGASS